MVIDSKIFNFDFFLSDRKTVSSLAYGAEMFGGATMFKEGMIYSNVENSEYIEINKDNNSISLLIPSTVEINKTTDNNEQVMHCIKQLQKYYSNKNITYYDTKGSWYSDTLEKVVIEDITIITVDTATVAEQDIEIFIELAEYIKQDMEQEGVSIAINNSLAIV